jgi:hypothetical protein
MRLARLAALLVLACRSSPPAASAVADAGAVSCIDLWLAQRDLNQFGDPVGTMYAGGTPLFDERTGRTTNRIDYLLRKHPDLQQACPTDVVGAHRP